MTSLAPHPLLAVPALHGPTTTVRFLHVGGSRHGVTRFGTDLAAAVAALGAAAVHDARCTAGVPAPDVGRDTITHLQFTDNVWGSDATAAAQAFAKTVAPLRGPVVVTLHDLPDPADDAARWARRARAYGVVARAADQVVVCSQHEAQRLRLAARGSDPVVIPNPLPGLTPGGDAPAGPARPDGRACATVGVLGWIFPGKGHGEVLQGLAGRGHLHVVALGAVAPGHQTQRQALTRRARAAGLAFSTTGWLDEDRQLQLVRAVDVPVAPHPRPSASGSMLAWIAAGRRPLVRRSPYAEELAARAPGAVVLYDRGALGGAVDAALDTPRTTWAEVGAPHHDELAPATAASRHLALYEGLR